MTTTEQRRIGRDEAVAFAQQRARTTGTTQAVWLIDRRFLVRDLAAGDRNRDGLFALCWPDGGVDYHRPTQTGPTADIGEPPAGEQQP